MNEVLLITALFAVFGLKAFQIQRQLSNGQYKWTSGASLAVCWSMISLVLYISRCDGVGCKPVMGFAFWAQFAAQFSIYSVITAKFIQMTVLVSYCVLTAYMFGHVVGWAFFGLRRLSLFGSLTADKIVVVVNAYVDRYPEAAKPIAPKTATAKIFWSVVAAWLLIGVSPAFVRIFAGRFLPAPSWVENSSMVSFVIAIAFSVIFLWFGYKVLILAPRERRKHALIWFFVPLLAFLISKSAITVAIPMLTALVAGSQVEMQFTVARADVHSRRCRSGVEFEGLPIMSDRVCGVEKKFRKTLTSGQRIFAVGRGTSLGLFATTLHN